MNKRKAKIGTFSTVNRPFKKECVFDLCSVQNSHISSVWEDQENLFLLTVFGLWLQPAVPVIVSQSVHHCHIAVTESTQNELKGEDFWLAASDHGR